jgi:predicted DNA-binding antitoxin AbrB/MazE fold protein
LEPLNLRDGEEVLAALLPAGEEKERMIEKLRRFTSKASKKDFDELLLEAKLRVSRWRFELGLPLCSYLVLGFLNDLL